jgi:iron complex outermembrane recepter protein
MNGFSTLCATRAILAIPGEVYATETQPPPEVVSSEVAAIEEIQVIAQERSENLQRVPIAVSFATEEDRPTEHITGTEQLPALVPRHKVGNGAGSGLFYLRVIGQNSGAPGIVNER